MLPWKRTRFPIAPALQKSDQVPSYLSRVIRHCIRRCFFSTPCAGNMSRDCHSCSFNSWLGTNAEREFRFLLLSTSLSSFFSSSAPPCRSSNFSIRVASSSMELVVTCRIGASSFLFFHQRSDHQQGCEELELHLEQHARSTRSSSLGISRSSKRFGEPWSSPSKDSRYPTTDGSEGKPTTNNLLTFVVLSLRTKTKRALDELRLGQATRELRTHVSCSSLALWWEVLKFILLELFVRYRRPR